MTLEERILASADRLKGDIDAIAETYAWLGAHDRAEPIFDRLLANFRRQPGESQDAVWLSRALGTCRYLTRARALAEEASRLPLGSFALKRMETASEIAECFDNAELPERVAPWLDTAATALIGETPASFRINYVIRNFLELLAKTRHPKGREILALVAAAGTADVYYESALTRFEAQLGDLDRAWERAAALVKDPMSLATVLADLLEAGPQHTDRLRDLLSRVEDEVRRGALMMSAARGLAALPDHVATAMELIDESLERIAGGTPANRFIALVSGAEIFAQLGENGRGARLAHEAVESLAAMTPVGTQDVVAIRALSRCGEVRAAYELYIERFERLNHQEGLALRNVAYGLPKPPDR